MVDLVAAAQDRERRRAARALQELPPLVLDRLDKARVSRRIVEIREHEVLPDENAGGIAGAIECVGLVHARRADAQHVDASLLRERDRMRQMRGIVPQRDGIERRPDRSSAEDGYAIHTQRESEPVEAAIDCDVAKSDAPELRVLAVDGRRYLIEARRAMRVREPSFDGGDAERADVAIVADARKRRDCLAASRNCRGDGSGEFQFYFDKTVASLEARRKP